MAETTINNTTVQKYQMTENEKVFAAALKGGKSLFSTKEDTPAVKVQEWSFRENFRKAFALIGLTLEVGKEAEFVAAYCKAVAGADSDDIKKAGTYYEPGEDIKDPNKTKGEAAVTETVNIGGVEYTRIVKEAVPARKGRTIAIPKDAKYANAKSLWLAVLDASILDGASVNKDLDLQKGQTVWEALVGKDEKRAAKAVKLLEAIVEATKVADKK